MADDFAKCIPIEMVYEGGYSNDPRDPGGVTLNGIIQRVDDGWRRNHGQAPRPLVKSMLGNALWVGERDAILRAQYWEPCRCDALPSGLDLVVFDGSLNSGPYQSALWLQRALRMNDIDGHIGEATIAAASNHPDHAQLIADVLARRLGMLQHLSTWDHFGGGWSARINNVRSIGQAWARADHVAAPAPIAAHEDGGHAKAYASDVRQPAVSEDAAKAGTGTGVGIAAVVQTSQQALQPLVGTSNFITHIYVGLTIAGLAVAVGGAGFVWWSSRQNSRARAAINGEVVAPLDDLDAATNGAPA